MSQQPHMIGRAILELDTGDLADVWSLQEEVSRLFQQQAVPEMARLFDRLVGRDEVVRLEQLVVDLGSIDRRFLADEFLRKLLSALDQKLSDTRQDLVLQNHLVNLQSESVPASTTRDRAGADWEVLLYFLRYGRLPWWVIAGDWQGWLPRWEAVIQSNSSWRIPLLTLLATHAAVRQRLGEQFPESFRYQLLVRLQPDGANWVTLLQQARQLIQRLELNSHTMQDLERQAWLLLLAEVALDQSFSTERWMCDWLLQLVQRIGQVDGGITRPEQDRGTGNRSQAIAPQRLRTIMTLFPAPERDLWFRAIDQVFEFTQANLSALLSNWAVLLYFLQQGRLPSEQSSVDWQTWLSRWEGVMQGDTNWQESIRRLLATSSAVRQRLVEQFPVSFRYLLIGQMQPNWTDWMTLLEQAEQLMQTLGLNSSTIQYLERQAWLLLLAEVALDQSFSTERWMRNWLTQFIQIVQVQGMGAFPAIAPQRLRTMLEATLTQERHLWLEAIDQVLDSASVETAAPVSDWAVLLFFLQQGHLPSEQPSTDWQAWLSRWQMVMQGNTNWQEPARKVLTANATTHQRLVEEFPESFRHLLILQLQPFWISWYGLLEEARQISQILNLSSEGVRSLEMQAWLLILAEVGTGREPLPTATWIQNWLAQLLRMVSPDVDRTPPTPVLEVGDPPPPIFLLAQRLRTALESAPLSEPELWLTALEQVLQPAVADFSMPAVSQGDTRDRQQPSQSTLSPEEETAGLYVTQAGLVLLHPFLPYYLEGVGLVEGEAFCNELAQQTALYLMYYLATKQTDAPEYELVVPKLLCGWPLDQPVVRGVELPEAALNEGENLLQTVINYWEVLKSTSPDGLREGFLQRDGKLTQASDGNWKLQVEQNSIDILLSSLPWGLSMVTLPWMEGLLIVEWS